MAHGLLLAAHERCGELRGHGQQPVAGLDPSTITKWGYAFADMTALTTIEVDSTWELPSGLSSSAKNQCFYGSKSLVGGNGTAFDSRKVSADMAVIDKADTPGYLTASS